MTPKGEYPSTESQHRHSNETLCSCIKIPLEVLDQKEKSDTEPGNDPIPQKCETDDWTESKGFLERRPVQRVIDIVRGLGNQNNVIFGFERVRSYKISKETKSRYTIHKRYSSFALVKFFERSKRPHFQ
jgi:hypothetical protein